MVNSCVAYRCNNLQDKRIKRQFHGFPFSRPDILKLWILAVRRENWKPSKASKLCSDHFKECDYSKRPGAILKLLKHDAVPSVFSFVPENNESEPISNAINANANNDEVENNNDVHSKPDAAPSVFCFVSENNESEPICNANNDDPLAYEPEWKKLKLCTIKSEAKNSVDMGTHPAMHLSPKITVLRRKIRTLQQNVRRRDRKIVSMNSQMKSLIKEINENGHSTDNLYSVLKQNFEGFPLEFVVHLHKNLAAKPQRRKYSHLMKQFSQTLYFYSPKAYKFVRQRFALPNPRALRKCLCLNE